VANEQMAVVASVASIVVGFGATILVFRIQRELEMQEREEVIWIARADWLVIIATTIAGFAGLILPLSIPWLQCTQLPAAACASAVALLIGYVFAILAHYRLVFGRTRSGPRENPEPAERVLFWGFIAIAVVVFIVSFTA